MALTQSTVDALIPFINRRVDKDNRNAKELTRARINTKIKTVTGIHFYNLNWKRYPENYLSLWRNCQDFMNYTSLILLFVLFIG